MCRESSRAQGALGGELVLFKCNASRGGHLSEVYVTSTFVCCFAVSSFCCFPFLLAFRCSNSQFSEGYT